MLLRISKLLNLILHGVKVSPMRKLLKEKPLKVIWFYFLLLNLLLKLMIIDSLVIYLTIELPS